MGSRFPIRVNDTRVLARTGRGLSHPPALGVADEEVLEAIAAHSCAGERLNLEGLLSHCLRAADLAGTVRHWQGRDKLKQLIYAGRIEEASLLQCASVIE